MSEVITTDEETVLRKSSLSDSDHLVIKKDNSELPLEESKPYLDTDATSEKDIDCDDTTTEKAAEKHETLPSDDAEQNKNTVPSVEVSQHSEAEGDSLQHPEENVNTSQQLENDTDTLQLQEDTQDPKNTADTQVEKSLSVIEEEKSAASSVSELIEAADSEDIKIETGKDI